MTYLTAPTTRLPWWAGVRGQVITPRQGSPIDSVELWNALLVELWNRPCGRKTTYGTKTLFHSFTVRYGLKLYYVHGVWYSVSMGSRTRFNIEAFAAIQERSGVTLRQLSRDSGLSYSHVWGIKEGRHDPTYTTIKKLAEGLKVPATALVSLDDEGAEADAS